MLLKIHHVKTDKIIEVASGTTFLSLFRQHRMDITSPCGGKGSCKKCQIEIEGLGPVLACQTQIEPELWARCGLTTDQALKVNLPEHAKAKITTDSVLPDIALEPLVCRGLIALAPGTLSDPRPDDTRFFDATGLTVPYAILNDFNHRLAVEDGALTYDFRIDTKEVIRFVDVTAPTALGCAIDIGTTTLAAYLYDLESGKRLAEASALNPQKMFGADVISRIEHAMQGNAQLAELQTVIVEGLNSLIATVITSANVSDLPLLLTLAGNTTMMHLLGGLDPTGLARAPFIPLTLVGQTVPATDLGLKIAPQGLAILLPSIASYVGADITAGILACGLNRAKKTGTTSILLDIGTNGEIVLAGEAGIVACSTAAGPAFEGANITFGMPAMAGAVDQARYHNGQLEIHVIGGPEATMHGICGSGVVAVIASLLDATVIDETGRLADDADAAHLSTDLRECLTHYEGMRAFRLSPAAQSPSIYLTQKDIRELQNAKAAMAAGLDVLLRAAAIKIEHVDHLYLAGGFGSYINIAQAIRIGLLPSPCETKVRNVGNSSGTGAAMCLLHAPSITKAAKVARKIHYLELSSNPQFSDLYIDAMMFPEPD
ncbi:MAG: ASKHA domain-containing protein [Eubacteriales bacterium]|nr:ASKHA domain-containing protein [Eubacteriales bacterium]